jgi:hypothetical protein
MSQRAQDSSKWLARFTAIGALATAVGAIATAITVYLLWQQLSVAAATLYSTNSYTVQKDLAQAYDRVSEAQDRLIQQGADRSQAAALGAALKRQVIQLDTLLQAVHALRNNGGISLDTWTSILRRTCPLFDASGYRLGDTPVPASKDACTDGRRLWKENPL